VLLTLLVSALATSAQAELVEGPVQTVADGFEFTEGPVWLPTGELLFSDIPADTIYRSDKSVFRQPSGKSNGLTLDREGRLIACEHWNRRVTRTEKDGSITVLADQYEGKKLNSPNDAVVRTDGTLFFTDPGYGLEGRAAELDFSGVYAVSPAGKLALLVRDFQNPNGLALSPDENTLYVADTTKSHIRAFHVAADGTLTGDREFCKVRFPDGIKVDQHGNVWSTSSDGICVFDPAGARLATISFPQVPANCAFGGDDLRTLYVTARTAVYSIQCTTAGIGAVATRKKTDQTE